jgi:hypothetical protein
MTLRDFYDEHLVMFDGVLRCCDGTRWFLATRVALSPEGVNLLRANHF